jgi:RNA:NAD 2'-phosphotransferase (TPT1/KptA family)
MVNEAYLFVDYKGHCDQSTIKLLLGSVRAVKLQLRIDSRRNHTSKCETSISQMKRQHVHNSANQIIVKQKSGNRRKKKQEAWFHH